MYLFVYCILQVSMDTKCSQILCIAVRQITSMQLQHCRMSRPERFYQHAVFFTLVLFSKMNYFPKYLISLCHWEDKAELDNFSSVLTFIQVNKSGP